MYGIVKIKESTSEEETNKLLDQGWVLLSVGIPHESKSPGTFRAVLGWDRHQPLPNVKLKI